ncbi:hypothetical protein [Flavobacterium sp. I3-2]|uniref:hypothetical protein n=1 Tax=Flavobacterium sp. I3-2 TaxID=2748319 RepID=UPI0015A814C9|nr:hypothetical protein [Flavobacterium sp. I3-2]
MTHKYLIFLLFLFTSLTNCFSQQRTEVQGKVVSRFRDLEGIYIENISARKNTTTEKGGYFKIEMQPNDTLIFASVNLKGIRRVIKESDFSKKLLFIPMEASEYTLDEMIIERKITAESLGIIKPRKKLTPTEKKLHTASSMATSAGLVSIDGFVNALSGRTAMLKKALEFEREELLMRRIINNFDEEFYVNELHIPKVYIEGFGFFITQDKKLSKPISAYSKAELKFLMSQKAIEYLEIIKELEK